MQTPTNADHTASSPLPSIPKAVWGLLRPAAYPHPVDDVELHQTATSAVFCTGNVAYKLKLPVHLGFVDYRDPNDRARYCEAELWRNRELGSTAYLDIRDVYCDGGGLTLHPYGDPVDKCVRMRQFPRGSVLADAVPRGAISRLQAHGFGTFLGEAHQKASVASGDHGAPMEAWSAVVANLDLVRRQGPAAGLVEAAHGRLLSGKNAAMRSLQRRRGLAVRRIHGDLHLGNAVLLSGSIEPFDAIEFSSMLQWRDVQTDVAFFAMDLEAHNAPALSVAFLSAYRGSAPTEWDQGLHDWLCAYAALIRAKSSAAQGLAERAQRYLALAGRSSSRD